MTGFFTISFLLNFKKFLIKKTFWIALVLLPLTLSFASLFLSGESTIVEISAGVFVNSENPLEAAIFQYMNSSVQAVPFVNFVLYDDKDLLLSDVRTGRIECAYIFNDNIENARRGDFTEIINLVTSPRTVAAPIFNDITAAAVLAATAQYIALDGLIAAFGDSYELRRFVVEQFEVYNQMDIFMSPSFIGEASLIESEPPTLFETTAIRIFHGLIGLSILIVSLFSTPTFIEERCGNLETALSRQNKLNIYDFSLWAAAAAAHITIGAIGLLSMFFFAPQLLAPAWAEISALIFYSALCSVFLLLFTRFIKSSSFIQSFGLLIVILNIFFGGMLLDLSQLFPALVNMQYLFPLYWYIEIILSYI